MKKNYKNIEYFVCDVDGVMTTGQIYYSSAGKVMKIFGPHDSDGLKIIKKFLKIIFITADKRGFKISKKRIVDDLGYKLFLVSENQRYNFLKKIKFKKIVYMADGFHDADLLKKSAIGIAPKNARNEARKNANFITESKAAEGAVLDAAIILKKKLKSNY